MKRFPTPEAFLGETPIRTIVIGAGGTGCQVLDGLASLDVALKAQGHAGFDVIVYDPDHVSPSNIGRQRFTVGDCGHNKSVMLVHRINAFHGLDWVAVPEAADPTTMEKVDLVITCVDRGAFRVALGEADNGWRARDVLWIDTGNGARSGQVICGHWGEVTTGMRLPNVLDLYGADSLRQGDEDDAPSCSVAEALTRQAFSVNRTVANAAIALLDDIVHRGGLDYHGSFIRLDPMTVHPLKIDTDVWASFGYPKAPARTRKKRKSHA